MSHPSSRPVHTPVSGNTTRQAGGSAKKGDAITLEDLSAPTSTQAYLLQNADSFFELDDDDNSWCGVTDACTEAIAAEDVHERQGQEADCQSTTAQGAAEGQPPPSTQAFLLEHIGAFYDDEDDLLQPPETAKVGEPVQEKGPSRSLDLLEDTNMPEDVRLVHKAEERKPAGSAESIDLLESLDIEEASRVVDKVERRTFGPPPSSASDRLFDYESLDLEEASRLTDKVERRVLGHLPAYGSAARFDYKSLDIDEANGRVDKAERRPSGRPIASISHTQFVRDNIDSFVYDFESEDNDKAATASQAGQDVPTSTQSFIAEHADEIFADDEDLSSIL